MDLSHTRGRHKSLVVAPNFSGDAPAKADVCNLQYFSSMHGCNVSEQKCSVVTEEKAGEAKDRIGQEKGRKGRQEEQN